MDELINLLDNLISCGLKLTETAEAIKNYYKTSAKEEPKTAELGSEEVKTYKDVEVRAALGEKAKIEDKKYKPQVKALVEKYSNDGTFSGIPESNYNELMKELEETCHE